MQDRIFAAEYENIGKQRVEVYARNNPFKIFYEGYLPCAVYFLNPGRGIRLHYSVSPTGWTELIIRDGKWQKIKYEYFEE